LHLAFGLAVLGAKLLLGVVGDFADGFFDPPCDLFG
jgi:hypothetical protein